MPFAELAKPWFAHASATLKPSSATRRDLALRQLFRQFGHLPVRNITRRDCEAWAAEHAKEVSASTYNKEVETLRLVLGYAKREGLVLENAAETLKRRKLEKGKRLIPTKDQFRILVETLRASSSRCQTAADLVALLAFSGMRLAEGTSLVWGDLDFDAERFVVTGGETGTKNHEAQPVPLFPAQGVRPHVATSRGRQVPGLGDRTTRRLGCQTRQRLRKRAEGILGRGKGPAAARQGFQMPDRPDGASRTQGSAALGEEVLAKLLAIHTLEQGAQPER